MYTKKKTLQLLMVLLLVLASFYANTQQLKGYEIAGNIEGLKEGEKVTMSISNNFFDVFEKRDSAYVENGVFHISGYVPDGPRLYIMEFDHHTLEITPPKLIVLFINNDEQITIRSGDINKIDHGYIDHYVTIEGSPTNHSYQCIVPAKMLYHQNMGWLNKQVQILQDSIGFDMSSVASLLLAKDCLNKALYRNFFDKGNDPDVTIASLNMVSLFRHSGNASFWVDAYNNLEDSTKNSFYGKKMREYIKLSVGQPFPEFTLPTTEGKPLSLKDIVTQSKMTIVNFWADQSIDREKYHKELKLLYKKFHDKGLNIIGFSSDKYEDQWKEAVKRYQLPWYNVSDLKGKDGMVENMYREYGEDRFIRNTTNYLIDSRGKIIAYDPTGIILEYYLKKTLGE